MRVSLLLTVIALWALPAHAGQEPGTAAPAPPAPTLPAPSAPPLPSGPGPLPDPIAPSPEEQQEEARLCAGWVAERRLALAYALRPEGIQWPLKADGQPSFKLEDLASQCRSVL